MNVANARLAMLLIGAVALAGAGCVGDRQVAIAAPTPPGMQGALSKVPPTRVTVPTPDDQRSSNRLLGQTKTAIGQTMGDNFATSDVPTVLRDTIVAELRAAGHQVGDEGVSVKLTILDFDVTTKPTALYWDIVGLVKVRLSVGSTTRSYDATRTKREYVNPGGKEMSTLLNGCLADIGKQFREDAVMAEAIRLAHE